MIAGKTTDRTGKVTGKTETIITTKTSIAIETGITHVIAADKSGKVE